MLGNVTWLRVYIWVHLICVKFSSTHLGKPIFMDLALCKLLRWNKTVATKLESHSCLECYCMWEHSNLCSLELRGQAKPINFEGVKTYFWPYIGMVLWTIAVGVLEFIKKNLHEKLWFWDCRCTYMFVQVSVFVVLSAYIYYTLNSHNDYKSHKIFPYFTLD